jgi:hypothetical protein
LSPARQNNYLKRCEDEAGREVSGNSCHAKRRKLAEAPSSSTPNDQAEIRNRQVCLVLLYSISCLGSAIHPAATSGTSATGDGLQCAREWGAQHYLRYAPAAGLGCYLSIREVDHKDIIPFVLVSCFRRGFITIRYRLGAYGREQKYTLL